jgi:urocanate hydratase
MYLLSVDNLLWIRNAGEYKLVVGSQARILYSDAVGRAEIACAFNKLVAEKKLKGPVVIRY